MIFPGFILPNIGFKGSGVTIPEEDVNNLFNTTEDGKQLIVVIGDSIARGTSDSDGPTPTAGTVYEWNGSSTVQVGSTDLVSAATGSPWPKMGIDYNTATTRKIVYSSSGSGGSNFSPDGDNNNWSTTGTLYNAMKTKVNNGLANIGLSRPRAIFMILGINDARASSNLATVEADVISLFDRLYTDYPNTRVYVVNVGRENAGIVTARIDSVRGYIQTEVTARENVFMAADLRTYAIDHPEYYDDDNLHLNQTGNNALGAELATFLENN